MVTTLKLTTEQSTHICFKSSFRIGNWEPFIQQRIGTWLTKKLLIGESPVLFSTAEESRFERLVVMTRFRLKFTASDHI